MKCHSGPCIAIAIAATCAAGGTAHGQAPEDCEGHRARYTEAPQGPDADRHLYNAGVCLEQRKQLGAAMAVFAQVERQFPASVLTQRALARRGHLHAQVADFHRAAQALERYAKKYPGEKDAPVALSTAFAYRRGLDQTDRAVENARRYLRAYGRRPRHRDTAAGVALTIADVYAAAGRTDDEIAALADYLKHYGRRGGRDRAVIAHARLGALLWRASCPVPAALGACLRFTRRGTAAPVRRAAALVKRARVHLRAAERAGLGARSRGLSPAAEEWLAAVRFTLAESLYEQALAAPSSLRSAAAADAARAYRDVLSTGSADGARWHIAASARTAQLWAKIGRPEDAAAANELCLELSKRLSWFDDWSRLCERALEAARPRAYPPLRERRGGFATAPPLRVEGLRIPARRPRAN